MLILLGAFLKVKALNILVPAVLVGILRAKYASIGSGKGV